MSGDEVNQVQNSGDQQGESVEQASAGPASWEEVLTTLPENLRALYDRHIAGLKNTVQATRQERDALAARLREIQSALGKDPAEAKQLIERMTAELEEAERRAVFYEQAGRPEIGCVNPRLAYLVATADGLFDKKGSPDWDAIKAAAPELFRGSAALGSVNGGAGTAVGRPPAASMNDFIRKAAGRR